MLDLANSEPGIPVLPDQLDANPWTLNVLNGAVDLRTGQLWPHRRQDLLTKLAPVAYDPDALCPTWDRFLLEVMNGDQDLVSFLQRAIGYTLTGDTSEQVIFILHGKGANGKSTLLETLRAMLGDDYTVQVRPETLMVKQGDAIPNDIARLKGARLVNARETEEGKRLAEALVKEMSGGDTITARFMRSEFFDFKPEFKLFLAANHKPTIRGTDLAIWRRIRLIPFAVTFAEEQQDKQLPKKLQAELPGILAWAVRGCLGWQVLGGLGTPAAVKQATEEYKSESDTLAAFLDECTIEDPNSETQAKVLYKAYVTWCEEGGETPAKQTMFGRKIKERLDSRVDKSSRLTYYLGLRLAKTERPAQNASSLPERE
jgi:putative DNA primase/helicase